MVEVGFRAIMIVYMYHLFIHSYFSSFSSSDIPDLINAYCICTPRRFEAALHTYPAIRVVTILYSNHIIIIFSCYFVVVVVCCCCCLGCFFICFQSGLAFTPRDQYFMEVVHRLKLETGLYYMNFR